MRRRMEGWLLLSSLALGLLLVSAILALNAIAPAARWAMEGSQSVAAERCRRVADSVAWDQCLRREMRNPPDLTTGLTAAAIVCALGGFAVVGLVAYHRRERSRWEVVGDPVRS